MTINREILLRRENEYLTKKIKEELDAWRKNNYESTKHTVISIVISSLALIFGIFLYITEKSNFGEEIKNVVSTSVIGAGGSVTLLGSLSSLKNLFKEVNENAEEFKNTMEIFKDLYQKTEPQQESNEILLEQLEEYYKDQKKIFAFLEGLNMHMHHMLICRSIIVTISSLVVLMLAIVSTFYLIINSDDYVFVIIDILLVCFAILILYLSICVMICIQLIIPNITEEILSKRRVKEREGKMKKVAVEEKFGEYKSKVLLSKLIKCLYKNVKGENGWFVKVLKNMEYKRINIGSTEFEGINRILYGLPLKELEIIVKKTENSMDQNNK
ncbi:36015_t:CDS:2 [Gigaspora margarita]|uniref:36015_t:CDS:1 n=1 Tax=Gigaspora margarita TaxID=4874 RepID=A0ABN7UB01_GIGMA|nr:36015_t:CDS:2 [Gigaspora margarita]